MRSWPAPSSRRRYGSRSRPGTRSPRTAPPDRRCRAPSDCKAAALSVWCIPPRPSIAPAADAAPLEFAHVLVGKPVSTFPGHALAHRWRELQSAFVPQRVQAARDLQWRALPDVAFERLAVIADLLDDAIGPVVWQTERFAMLALAAEQPLDVRVVGFLLLVDVGLGDAELLGIDHGVMGPLHDVEPLVVAVAHGRSERLLGDDFWQDDVVIDLGEPEPLAGKAGGVGGVGVAAAGVVGLDGFGCRRKRHSLELHLVGAEIVGEIQLGGGALLNANRGVAEFERRVELQRLPHQEALPVIIIDAGEVQPERRVARRGPGGVARQHVDLTRLQRGEAVLGGQRHDLHFIGVVEDRPRQGLAEIDVEAGPAAWRVRQAEAGERAVRSAVQHAALLDGVERLGRGSRCGNPKNSRKCGANDDAFHSQNSQNAGTTALPWWG